MIRAVLFDYGGVLTPGGTAGCMRRLFAQVFACAPEDIAVDYDVLRQGFEGRITEQAYYDAINNMRTAGPRITRESYLAATDVFEKSEPVYDLAIRLRAAGIHTGILSNINDIVAEELQKRGFYDGFDPLILSYREHVAKPDPQIYQIALERLGMKPDEVVMVDDQAKWGQPAADVGMYFIVATSPEQIVQDVTALVKAQNNIHI